MRAEEEHLSLREAADALGITEVTARRWVKSGKLRAYQPGRKYLIPTSAVEALLEGAEAPKASAPPRPEPSFNDVLEEERRTSELAEDMARRARAALDDRILKWKETQPPTAQELLEFVTGLLAMLDTSDLRQASESSANPSFEYQVAVQRLRKAKSLAAQLAQSDADAEERRAHFRAIEGELSA